MKSAQNNTPKNQPLGEPFNKPFKQSDNSAVIPNIWHRPAALIVFAIINLIAAGIFYNGFVQYMDIYDKIILLATPFVLIYAAYYFKALRWYLPTVYLLSAWAVWVYDHQLLSQKKFLLKYFLSSQLAILWMSVAIMASLIFYGIYLFKKSTTILFLANKSAWLAAILGLTGMFVRWHESYLVGVDIGHIPVSNLYEVFILFILLTLLYYFYFLESHQQSLKYIEKDASIESNINQQSDKIYASHPNQTSNFESLGFFVMLIVAAATIFTVWYAVSRQASQIQALVPALQSWWMKIHVPANFIGYATFAIAAMFAVAFLIKTQKTDAKTIKHIQNNLPSTNTLNDLMQKAISIGFAFFTLATILGAFWAAEAWGGYWSWDPKEVWALIVWLNYAAWLHAKLISGWHGRTMAWWAIIGLLITSFAFMGVNMFLSGLHSYGQL
jgi:cytochrome c-type biogenesis protein CcsB